MKRVFFLLIGILAFSVACQDNFVETDNDATQLTKSAKYEKVQTFPIKGWVKATPDTEQPEVVCNPTEAGVSLKGMGWVSGRDNILGKFDPENSTYGNEFCELIMTDEGPVVYARTNVILQRMNGEQIFVVNHMWISVLSGEIAGYNEIYNGTGRFEGASGQTNMLNGAIDLLTGIATWEEDGYITLILKH